MATPYLGITHIAESQNEKEVTANDAFDSLDSAINGNSAIAMTDADYTATNLILAGAVFFGVTGTLTADRNFILPTGQARLFVIENGTTGSHSLVVKTASGSTAAVTNGSVKILYSDGTNVIALT
jgi:hypothetical protein